MEVAEDIVIVGAGIAGLATALGLHRRGMRCLVLESADHLRSNGFALLTWSNAWKALDALGVGDSLRRQHVRLQGLVAASTATGFTTTKLTFMEQQGKCREHELRCLRRNSLVETLERELPVGTIRFSSKVALIEEQGNLKLLHLADGSIIKTKVLIGCDGVNSVVAKWLGLKKAAYAGRSASRGIVEFPNGHGFKPEFLQYFGDGIRSGFLPCDEKHVYWFFTYSTPSGQDHKELEEDMLKMKQFVLSKLGKVPEEVHQVIEKSEPSSIICSPLRFRWPCDLLWGQICKGNVCLAGDALHAMTPDLGQGGCSALEDGVTLARCLADASLLASGGGAMEAEHDRFKVGLENYVKQRKWRSFELVTTAYVVGLIQQSDGVVMNMLRDKWLSAVMARKLLRMSTFDCGKLSS